VHKYILICNQKHQAESNFFASDQFNTVFSIVPLTALHKCTVSGAALMYLGTVYGTAFMWHCVTTSTENSIGILNNKSQRTSPLHTYVRNHVNV
jgi:hypothetical protein